MANMTFDWDHQLLDLRLPDQGRSLSLDRVMLAKLAAKPACEESPPTQ